MAERETLTVIQNDEANQFEIHLDGQVALLEFRKDGDRIVYPHTSVPKEFGGRGIAGQLAKHALDYARANNLRVVPQCPFVRKYIAGHAEYQDLVD